MKEKIIVEGLELVDGGFVPVEKEVWIEKHTKGALKANAKALKQLAEYDRQNDNEDV